MTAKRVILLLIVAVFLGTGCAKIKEMTVDARTCLADPVCREEAVAIANSTKVQAVAIAGISPIPLSTNLVGGVAYGAALIIALIRGGRKRKDGTVA